MPTRSMSSEREFDLVFLGSSSIEMWPLDTYFSNFTKQNLGVGGADLMRIIYDKNREGIVAKNWIIYAGENDIAADKSVDSVLKLYEMLLSSIREQSPAIRDVSSSARIFVLSVKSAPSRKKYFSKFAEFNLKLKSLADKFERVEFVDTAGALLDVNGEIVVDNYLDDQLHLSGKGYDLWSKALIEKLK